MQTTNQLLEDLYKNINNLGNLIALDNFIHAMFDKRILTLTPLIHNLAPIKVHNNYSSEFLLLINHLSGLAIPELIQSTKVPFSNLDHRVSLLVPGSTIKINPC